MSGYALWNAHHSVVIGETDEPTPGAVAGPTDGERWGATGRGTAWDRPRARETPGERGRMGMGKNRKGSRSPPPLT